MKSLRADPAADWFAAELAALPSHVGERHKRIFTIALKGRTAGYSPEEVIERIIASSGEPPMGRHEVEEAVKNAWQRPERQPAKLPRSGMPRKSALKRALVPPRSEPTKPEPSTFVRRMIAAGGGTASSRDLIALSPIVIHPDPCWQALDFCMALNEPDTRYFFLGEPRQKRTRERLHALNDIEAALAFGDMKADDLPTLILPNDLTGEPAKNARGEDSYALESCILHRRYAVVEFDAMPLEEQAAFWLGVIRSDMLPVRSLVFSGKKSIHGLLRLDDDEPFAAQWRVLERSLASDPEAKYRCDVACKNPGRMTRFPGARRPGAKYRQSLLYLSA